MFAQWINRRDLKLIRAGSTASHHYLEHAIGEAKASVAAGIAAWIIDESGATIWPPRSPRTSVALHLYNRSCQANEDRHGSKAAAVARRAIPLMSHSFAIVPAGGDPREAFRIAYREIRDRDDLDDQAEKTHYSEHLCNLC